MHLSSMPMPVTKTLTRPKQLSDQNSYQIKTVTRYKIYNSDVKSVAYVKKNIGGGKAQFSVTFLLELRTAVRLLYSRWKRLRKSFSIKKGERFDLVKLVGNQLEIIKTLF